MDDENRLLWADLKRRFREEKQIGLSADWIDGTWHLSHSDRAGHFRDLVELAAQNDGYRGDSSLIYWLDKFRKNKAYKAHFRQLNAATRNERDGIRIQEMGTIPNVWLASADFCAKHAGGRPRKDKERAQVMELRIQRKKYREIKEQMDEKNREYLTEDAYRKRTLPRKTKIPPQIVLTGKNSTI